MKSRIGILLTATMLILGIVGVLMSAANFLPPGLHLPIIQNIIMVLTLLITGLGWQDELEGGKKGLIDLITKFFADPYRKLLLTAVLFVAKDAVGLPGVPVGLQIGAQIFLAVAAVFGFGSAVLDYRVKLFAKWGR